MSLAFACASGSVATKPAPPNHAEPRPIFVTPGSTARIAFRGVAYEIEAGTETGLTSFRGGFTMAPRAVRWEGPTNPNQFNTNAERCLREAGYTVETSGDRLFPSTSTEKRSLLMGAVVTKIWTETVQNTTATDRSHQEVTLEGKIRLFDPNAEKILYEASFTGYGTHMGSQPSAYPAAFENLLKHALADQTFIEAASAR